MNILRRRQRPAYASKGTRVERVPIDDFDALISVIEACEKDGWRLLTPVAHPSYMVLFFTRGA